MQEVSRWRSTGNTSYQLPPPSHLSPPLPQHIFSFPLISLLLSLSLLALPLQQIKAVFIPNVPQHLWLLIGVYCLLCTCMCMCVCISKVVLVFLWVWMCKSMCVCVRERERTCTTHCMSSKFFPFSLASLAISMAAIHTAELMVARGWRSSARKSLRS